MAQSSFEDKILGCVDRGMASLGESARQAILWHIERNSHVKRKEIPTKPKQFIDALKVMLGPGVYLVERLIVREVHLAFGIAGSLESFGGAVSRARGVWREREEWTNK
ncbi:MAG: hypothetical protein PXY39_11875 [archaeon]|nr:hypothetical protein [archaeon]